MVDSLSSSERSKRMSLIRSKNTKPEMLVRRAVWAAGFRYRLHHKNLPGRPDLVFPGIKTVVFVHGCFWHGHSCQKGRIPGSNSGFWIAKFDANKKRDRRNRSALDRDGWRVATVWECSLSSKSGRERSLKKLLDFLELSRKNHAA